MTPSAYHNEHRSGRSRSGASSNVRRCYAPTHVHGGHDRVVPYDPDCHFGTGSPSAFRRGVYYPSLTSRGLRAPGAFSSFLLSRPSSLAVLALGAGVMDSSICHPRCTILSRRAHRLREQSVELTFRRISHDLQNLADALHNHVLSLSKSLACPVPQHDRTRGQTVDQIGQKGAA